MERYKNNQLVMGVGGEVGGGMVVVMVGDCGSGGGKVGGSGKLCGKVGGEVDGEVGGNVAGDIAGVVVHA
jgi:hypothetical protein